MLKTDRKGKTLSMAPVLCCLRGKLTCFNNWVKTVSSALIFCLYFHTHEEKCNAFQNIKIVPEAMEVLNFKHC